MIITCVHDGEKYKPTLFDSHGFFLDEKRDIKEVSIYNPKTGEMTGDTEAIVNFVGFVTNNNDDLLVSFPKHYQINNSELDAKSVFDCIFTFEQRKPETFIGNNSDKQYKSNYPFSSFFEVYDYYINYGLYIKDEIFIKPNTGGRLNWKETISKSQKGIINGNLIMFPLYYRKNYHLSNFLTECMIFVIDYTIQKFSVVVDALPTGRDFPEFNFIEEKNYVLNVLEQLKQQTFKDNELKLITALIEYFSDLNVGGNYYLKHYNFSSIWEDMVTEYLCKYFKEVNSSHEIIFDEFAPSGLKFKKQSFHTNEANPMQYISPDHYWADNNTQLIFDAKYYTHINGLNYKQIAYLFMLKDMLDKGRKTRKFLRTYSALILPSESRKSKIHFKLDPNFGVNSDLYITEEYLDIKDVINSYLNLK